MSDAILRTIHVLAGIMWIGLLYYFNFVNVAATAQANAAGEAGAISKYVMPGALLYFRMSAIVTWLFGAALLGGMTASTGANGFIAAFALQGNMAPIGIGAWLGTIMLLNVWGIIWRSQKKALGLVPATDQEKAKSRRIAFVASRVNLMLSIPLVFFMVTGPHQSIYH